jgi:hypothetical protein
LLLIFASSLLSPSLTSFIRSLFHLLTLSFLCLLFSLFSSPIFFFVSPESALCTPLFVVLTIYEFVLPETMLL